MIVPVNKMLRMMKMGWKMTPEMSMATVKLGSEIMVVINAGRLRPNWLSISAIWPCMEFAKMKTARTRRG